MDSPLFVVLAVLVPVLLAAVGVVQGRRRAAATRAWAAAIGWTYAGTDPSLVTRWRGRPFGLGDNRRASEVVTGRFGPRTATSFAYRYTSGSGKSRSTSVFHVVSLSLPAYLPTVELTPDGLGAMLARAFGGQDIAFESEAFNQEWRVAAPSAKAAHDLIHPRVMERLLRPDARGLSIRVEGTDILCWTTGAPDLSVVASRLGVLAAIVDAVPRYVWLDHGYDPART
ncbi:MAG TPA: hypothetical protein VN257_10255 [Actinotalea sp.]|nr:hypothetical protein [Actinotalea sp.]